MAVITTHLPLLLRRASRLMVVFAALTTGGLFVAAGVAVLLAAVFLDARFSFSPAGLVFVDVITLLLAAAGVGFLIIDAIRHRYGPRRLARFIEETCNIGDNRLINAVDLAGQNDAATSPVLRAMAVERGDTLAAAIEPSRVVDRRPVFRAAGVAAAAVAVAVVAVLVWPGVFSAVIPRYLHPWGDRPGYTPIRFAVMVEPKRVERGEPAVIRVKLEGVEAGELPGEADLVVVQSAKPQALAEAAGGSEDFAVDGERLPMARDGDGVFTLRMTQAGRSSDFYIDTKRGRSGVCHMEVEAVSAVRETVEQPGEQQGAGERGSRGGQGNQSTPTVSSPRPTKEMASHPIDTTDLNESFDPAAAGNLDGERTFLAGVPARFRDAAAVYFKRLAEEGAGEKGD